MKPRNVINPHAGELEYFRAVRAALISAGASDSEADRIARLETSARRGAIRRGAARDTVGDFDVAHGKNLLRRYA